MIFDYFELLSGEPVFLENVGWFKSPHLKELKPQSGIGFWNYSLYLNILSWDKNEFLKYLEIINLPSFSYLQDISNDLPLFHLLTVHPNTRELIALVLGFFLDGQIMWHEQDKNFRVYSKLSEVDGTIHAENFEQVRKAMLELNFIGVNKEDESDEITPTSKRAAEQWDKVQMFLKKQAAVNDRVSPEKQKQLVLPNLISKMCVANTGYNLLNIYDLTVFQFYDQFLQYGYLRSINLGERIYANHGGDSFNIENWLNPIIH